MNFFIFRGVVGDQNCPIRAILLVNVSVLYLKKTLSNDLQNDFWPLIHVKSFQSSNITWYKVHIPICSHLKVCKSGLKWAIHSWILLFLWKWPNQWVTVGHETHFFPYQKVLGKICQKHNHQAFLKFNLIPKIFPVFQKLSKKWYHKYNCALISVYAITYVLSQRYSLFFTIFSKNVYQMGLDEF